MNQTSSFNFLFLELEGEGIAKAIELGAVTLEEMEATRNAYDAFIEKLEQEWPSERLKEFVLTRKREGCKWAVKKIEALELENRDARVKGVSFKERQTYTTKINALKKLFSEYREQGIYWSKQTPHVIQFAKPVDVEFIQSRGFETHLKLAII